MLITASLGLELKFLYHLYEVITMTMKKQIAIGALIASVLVGGCSLFSDPIDELEKFYSNKSNYREYRENTRDVGDLQISVSYVPILMENDMAEGSGVPKPLIYDGKKYKYVLCETFGGSKYEHYIEFKKNPFIVIGFRPTEFKGKKIENVYYVRMNNEGHIDPQAPFKRCSKKVYYTPLKDNEQ